ncbi:MAG: hypothetical protein WKG07_08470 [Hymenobacter sp.]
MSRTTTASPTRLQGERRPAPERLSRREHALSPILEPRLAARYLLTDEWALKATYARTTPVHSPAHQQRHRAAHRPVGAGHGAWCGPSVAHQFSLGAARTLRYKGEAFEFSFETYYKPMQQPGGVPRGRQLPEHYRQRLAAPRSRAARAGPTAASCFCRRKPAAPPAGSATRWPGATASFPELNQGRTFPYKYDRRHDISLVVMHHFSPTLTLSGTWVYGTGNATTLASGALPGGHRPDFRRLRRPQLVSDGGLPPLRPRPEQDQEKALGRSGQQPVYLQRVQPPQPVLLCTCSAAYVDYKGAVQRRPATARCRCFPSFRRLARRSSSECLPPCFASTRPMKAVFFYSPAPWLALAGCENMRGRDAPGPHAAPGAGLHAQQPAVQLPTTSSFSASRRAVHEYQPGAYSKLGNRKAAPIPPSSCAMPAGKWWSSSCPRPLALLQPPIACKATTYPGGATWASRASLHAAGQRARRQSRRAKLTLPCRQPWGGSYRRRQPPGTKLDAP